MKNARTLLAIATLGLSTAVFAAPVGGSNVYMYGDIGQSRYDADDATARLGPGASSDETDFAGSVGAGYQFSPNFALEAGYLNLGKMTANRGVNSSEYSAQGIAFQAVGTVPLNDRFGLYGTAGLNPLYVKSSYNGVSDNEWRVAPSLGLGVNFKVNEAVGLRAGYTRYFNAVDNRGVKSDADLMSVGMTYAFK
ncbi:Outer membrane protein A [Andreprevotia sp. IGB-42]|uniref:outer membrane beta-barrel protein n=1 Tax=Andreprevotia sp. IGB-42 TaxID=2497473 RepID=UPI00135B4B1C|nr:outer membrane beta-barrel protein [Andreprevotia sp. IGB-42]KAF0811826.1 Outer membrane protein A [Andreprevotia sp. IGB-42]